jgi:hypothetical protein
MLGRASMMAGEHDDSAMLEASEKAAAVIDAARYFPLAPGYRWNYASSADASPTTTDGSAVTLPTGASTIPVTAAVSGQSGTTTLYYTNDANGLRRHREHATGIYIRLHTSATRPNAAVDMATPR